MTEPEFTASAAAKDLSPDTQNAARPGGSPAAGVPGTDAAATGTPQAQSAGELVQQLSEQVSRLIRDELKLAQLEVTRKGKQAGLGIGMLGGSGLVALYGVAGLLAAAVIALSGVVAAWLAALIAGAALLAVSAVAALLGKRQLQKAAPPVPEQAVGSIKADIKEISERAHP